MDDVVPLAGPPLGPGPSDPTYAHLAEAPAPHRQPAPTGVISGHHHSSDPNHVLKGGGTGTTRSVSSNPALPFNVSPTLISPLRLSHLDPLHPSPVYLPCPPSLPMPAFFQHGFFLPHAIFLLPCLPSPNLPFSPYPLFLILPMFPIRIPQLRFSTSHPPPVHPLSTLSPSLPFSYSLPHP